MSHGNDTTTKSLRVVVVHGTQKYNFDAEDSRTTTVLALKLKLKDILGLKSINRIKLVGKGKVLTDDQVKLATLCSSSSKKKSRYVCYMTKHFTSKKMAGPSWKWFCSL